MHKGKSENKSVTELSPEEVDMVRGFMGGGSGWLSSIAPNTNKKISLNKAVDSRQI